MVNSVGENRRKRSEIKGINDHYCIYNYGILRQ